MMYLKSIPKRNPQAPEETPKYYASAIHSERVEIEDLTFAVSQRCSLRRSDVLGAIIALMDLIPQELLEGKIVALGELGSFYANVSSTGVLTPEELSVNMVVGTKIQYRPTNLLKQKLRMIDFRIE